MEIDKIIVDEIEEFLKSYVKDKIFLKKLKKTIQQTFNAEELKNYVEQQDNNTYIIDFIDLLHKELFGKIINMLCAVDANKTKKIRNSIYEESYEVTDGSEIQNKNIKVLLDKVIYSIEYCWNNSLNRDDRYLLNKIKNISDGAESKELSLSGVNSNDYNGKAKFQSKYESVLFLEERYTVKLKDVFIFPNIVISKTMNFREYINDLIEHKVANKILFLIGKAGTGKSSLLYYFSTVYNSENIYYLSLKDLIINGSNRIHFLSMVNKHLHLKNDARNKTLILDGFDEIRNLLIKDEFLTDLERYFDNGFSIIFTTRPDYIFAEMENEQRYPFIKFGYLDFFDEYMISEWLDRYRTINKTLSDETINSIKEITKNQSLFSVVSIPIILYIIANQNIKINAQMSFCELYDMVFTNLSRDKASLTKDKYINIHYMIAKEVAFIMYSKDWMKISSMEIRNNLSIIFDETFYSSVYMNRIIEGEYFSEFVHKSIQDFFASKWIWEHLILKDYDYGDMYILLSKKEFSNEIIEYMTEFYENYEDKEGIYDKVMNIIKGFVLQGFCTKDFLNYNDFINMAYILLINVELISKRILKRYLLNNDTMFTEKLVGIANVCDFFISSEKKNYEEILKGFKFNKISVLCNSPTSKYYFSSNVFCECDFSNKIIESIQIMYSELNHCRFEKSKISEIILIDCSVYTLDFSKTRVKSVRFSKCDIKNAILTSEQLKLHIDDTKIYRLLISCNGFYNTHIENSVMEDARIVLKYESYWRESQFVGNTFSDTYLGNIIFCKCKFKNVDFRNCKLNNIEFRDCSFDDTSFIDCTIGRKNFLTEKGIIANNCIFVEMI